MAGLRKKIASFSQLQTCIQRFQGLFGDRKISIHSYHNSLDLSTSLLQAAVETSILGHLGVDQTTWLKEQR